ncbi:uncharacterized protein F5Z01DRAFT_647740 [Emericellopsis atlantica]|uniref:N-acetyltransferase domain-containing protein n=1 Tax=Emericellopsis atlantica TaxID=2614577 RepID=A0A9P8CS84_9HYPO|nr:uncharacterized protein F5Z01DRAFT_647740 [Emericellopsis atlantica]KAG9257112.1 hypothetical protein F5Z01DRAFT_647740 [Emericellopsis atlantica]
MSPTEKACLLASLISSTLTCPQSTPEARMPKESKPTPRLAVSAAINGASEWLATCTPTKVAATSSTVHIHTTPILKEQQKGLTLQLGLSPETPDGGRFGDDQCTSKHPSMPTTAQSVIVSSAHSDIGDQSSDDHIHDASNEAQSLQLKAKSSTAAFSHKDDRTLFGQDSKGSPAELSLNSDNGHDECSLRADGLDSWESDGSQPKSAHFVHAWLQAIRVSKCTDLTARLSDPDRQHQDIDTESGEFLQPCQHPSTVPFPDLDEDAGMQWKRQNMTPALHIREDLDLRRRVAYQKQQREIDQEWARREAERTPSPTWPQSDYPIRPAVIGDMAKIAEIMTMESQAEKAPQIIASAPITAEDVRYIFDRSISNYRPFVVAFQEDVLLHLHSWPKGSEKAHEEYVKFRAAQPCEAEKVVGFAFVDEARVGFLQTACPGSRHSGQIRVVVHPEYRRQKIGQSLLDCVLTRIITGYQSQIDYKWECADEMSIYSRMRNFNVRDYAHLFVEVLVQRGEKADGAWQSGLLEKLDFEQVAHLDMAVRTDRGSDSAWLDLQLWQLNTGVVVRDKAPGAYLEDV